MFTVSGENTVLKCLEAGFSWKKKSYLYAVKNISFICEISEKNKVEIFWRVSLKIFGSFLTTSKIFSNFLESSLVFRHPLKYSGIVGEWPEVFSVVEKPPFTTSIKRFVLLIFGFFICFFVCFKQWVCLRSHLFQTFCCGIIPVQWWSFLFLSPRKPAFGFRASFQRLWLFFY